MQKQWLALVLAGGILAWFAGCGSGSSGTDAGSRERPGACVCFDGSLNFRSCVVTADLQTCRRTVTTCDLVHQFGTALVPLHASSKLLLTSS